MTALSTLFPAAGGGGVAYPSGKPIYIGWTHDWNRADASTSTDYLIPFVPRADVTIDEVFWFRHSATAGNIYVGIYDKSGNLLTDCAVDSDTTVGFHAVSTTAADLTGGEMYYFCINASASVIKSEAFATTDESFSAQMSKFMDGSPPDPAMFSGASVASLINVAGAMEDSRANAALPDPITLTGLSLTNIMINCGVVAQ